MAAPSIYELAARHVEALCGIGVAAHTQNGDAFFQPRWNGAGAAMPVDSREFRTFVARNRGVGPKSPLMAAVIDAMTVAALRRGRLVDPARLAAAEHKDGRLVALRYHLGAGQVVRLSQGGADVVNPERDSDGRVLFVEERDFKPLDLAKVDSAWPKRGEIPALKRALIGDLPPLADDSPLSAVEFTALVLAFWLGIFLSAVARARPIQVLLGEGGSGKSTIQRVEAKLFSGESGEVAGSAGNDRVLKDLASGAVYRSLVVRDDVTALPPGGVDVLCRVATGTTFDVSTFHETLSLSSYRSSAAVSLSATSVDWAQREDLLSRLLITKVKRSLDPSPVVESERYERALTNREAVWAESLALLQELTTPDTTPTPLVSRFDDWERGVRRMLRVVGMEEDLVSALTKMTRVREQVAREADPISDVVATMAEDATANNRWWRAASAMDEVQRRLGVEAPARDPHRARGLFSDPNRFGKFLRDLKTKNTALFTVHSRKGHNNTLLWAFTPRGAPPPPAEPTIPPGNAGGVGVTGGSSPTHSSTEQGRGSDVSAGRVLGAAPLAPTPPLVTFGAGCATPATDFVPGDAVTLDRCPHCGCCDHLPAECPDAPSAV